MPPEGVPPPRPLPAPEGPFLAALFEALAHEKIAYCVLRNAESLPQRVPGTDIDLLIARRQIKAAEALIATLAARHGWYEAGAWPKNYRIRHLRFARASADGFAVLRFDLASDIGMGPIRFLKGEGLLATATGEHGLTVSPKADQAAVNLLNALWSGMAPKKESYAAQAARLLAEPEGALRQRLAEALGRGLVRPLPASLDGLDWAGWSKRARAALWRRAVMLRLWGLAGDLCRYGANLAGRFIAPPGQVCTLNGPNAPARALAQELSRLLSARAYRMGDGGVRVLAEGPWWFGREASLAGIARYWRHVRPWLAKGELVIALAPVGGVRGTLARIAAPRPRLVLDTQMGTAPTLARRILGLPG